ncbi:uncharacterized protein LOC127857880 isoform X2 [Dreissena polymorpha]|uniref:uncharacterized protein LOC127857880 isoform X2 n=1 Tax=Dreissena polymorpha TaxID=45954 RepID=UPI0022640359|nr:uncharacterized protein LOC127857880 isoform X2 [Dreissena polymorpha]
MGSAPSCGSNVRNIDTHLQRLSSNQKLTEDELNMLTTMLRTKASEAMEIKHKLADDGLYVDSIRKTIALFFINTCSHKFNKVKQRVKFIMEISTILLQTKFINIIRGCLIKLHIRGWVNVDGTVDKSAYDLIRWSMSFVVDLADVSDELSFSLANDKNYMAAIKTILEDKSTQYLQSDISPLSDFDSEIIENCLKVVTNISRWSNCAQLLRNHNFTKVIKPYLNSSDELTSLAVLSALAAIVNESECDIINAALDKVQLLLDVLKHGLDENDRRYRGWSCKECAYTVKTLVRNDANKQLLVELGVLELLVKMGRTGNEEEQCESVNAAWALCFNKDTQQKVAKDESLGLVELLFDLKTSSNSHIRKTCNGALWTLRDVLASSEYQKNRIFGISFLPKRANSLIYLHLFL